MRSRPTALVAATTVGWAYGLGRFHLISLVQDFCWDGSLSWQKILRSVRHERAEEDAGDNYFARSELTEIDKNL